MSDPLHYIDGRLVIWGERWDWSPQNSKPRIAKKSKLGATLVAIAMHRPAPAPITPATVRKTLHGFARKTTPVLVKISGGGKGLAHIAAHMSYICRDGKLALEDEEGNDHAGKDAVEDLRDLWAMGNRRSRKKANIVKRSTLFFPCPTARTKKRYARPRALSPQRGSAKIINMRWCNTRWTPILILTRRAIPTYT